MSLKHSIAVRMDQKTQYVADLRGARPKGFIGRPVIHAKPCEQGCTGCRDVCPTQAITLNPVALDLGRCVFCDACVDVCPEDKIEFTNDTRMGASTKADLIVKEGDTEVTRARAHATFAKLFGRSLKMRQVSAGGCNACELELNALANVNFDVQRFGIEWVASPRHADALVLSGPITKNMQDAVELTWDAMPDPRFVVAVGACGISGGLYAEAPGASRSFLDKVGPVLFVPGCPPHPLTFVHAILDLLDRP